MKNKQYLSFKKTVLNYLLLKASAKKQNQFKK